MARIRAGESGRPDRLFDDPYAAAFVTAMPAYADESTNPEVDRATAARLAVHVILRTRFYDDYLREATATGIRQVVLLAAGLDSRAFRLDWPAGTRVFELDLPPVLAFKDRVMAGHPPTCTRIAVPADLTADWPAELRAAGFEPATPTAWLVEGLLIYLTDADAARLLTTVTGLSARGSRLGCERGRTTIEGAAGGVTTLWQGGLGEGVDDWLGRNGWHPHVHGLADVAAGYGRPLRAETTSAFVTAGR